MTLVAHHPDQSCFESTPELVASGFSLAASRLISTAVTTTAVWLERAMQRRRLLALSDGALKDFGRTRCDAVREGSKHFWQM